MNDSNILLYREAPAGWNPSGVFLQFMLLFAFCLASARMRTACSSYSMIPAGYRSPVAKAGFSASAFSLLTSFLSPGASLISPAEVAA